MQAPRQRKHDNNKLEYTSIRLLPSSPHRPPHHPLMPKVHVEMQDMLLHTLTHIPDW